MPRPSLVKMFLKKVLSSPFLFLPALHIKGVHHGFPTRVSPGCFSLLLLLFLCCPSRLFGIGGSVDYIITQRCCSLGDDSGNINVQTPMQMFQTLQRSAAIAGSWKRS